MIAAGSLMSDNVSMREASSVTATAGEGLLTVESSSFAEILLFSFSSVAFFKKENHMEDFIPPYFCTSFCCLLLFINVRRSVSLLCNPCGYID